MQVGRLAQELVPRGFPRAKKERTAIAQVGLPCGFAGKINVINPGGVGIDGEDATGIKDRAGAADFYADEIACSRLEGGLYLRRRGTSFVERVPCDVENIGKKQTAE